jgi:hypothetical protein
MEKIAKDRSTTKDSQRKIITHAPSSARRREYSSSPLSLLRSKEHGIGPVNCSGYSLSRYRFTANARRWRHADGGVADRLSHEGKDKKGEGRKKEEKAEKMVFDRLDNAFNAVRPP